MAKTTIEWTEENWNPFYGCRRKSPGCENCYAEQMAGRFSGTDKNGKILPYNGIAKKVGKHSRWTGEVKLNEEILLAPLKIKKPTLFFVNSMSDTFYSKFPDEWIDKLFAVMALCPQHTFQVLSKRAQRMRDYFKKKDEDWVDLGISETAAEFIYQEEVFNLTHKFGELLPHIKDAGWWYDYTRDEYGGDSQIYFEGKTPLKNVWLGVSVENQKAADERIPLLLETPAAIRFLSCEPLLEEIDLTRIIFDACANVKYWGIDGDLRKIDWVIAGGESGTNARPCNIEWIRSIVRQCQSANVPVFVKQLGAYCQNFTGGRYFLTNKKGGDISEFPKDLQIRQMPTT